MSTRIKQDDIIDAFNLVKGQVARIERFNQSVLTVRIRNVEDWGVPGPDGYVELLPATNYEVDFRGQMILPGYGLRIPDNGGVVAIRSKLRGSQTSIVSVNPAISTLKGGANTSVILEQIGFINPVGIALDLDGGWFLGNPESPLMLIDNVRIVGSAKAAVIQNYFSHAIRGYTMAQNGDGITFAGQFFASSFDVIVVLSNFPGYSTYTFDDSLIIYSNFSFINQLITTDDATQSIYKFEPGAVIGPAGVLINNVTFNGAGTYLDGIDPQDNRIKTTNVGQNPVQFEESSVSGAYRIDVPATTIITNTVDWVKLAGTTVVTKDNKFVQLSDNELQYIGAFPETVGVTFDGSLFAGSNNSQIEVTIGLNGVADPNFRNGGFAKTSGDPINIGLNTPLSLSPLDTITIYTRNTANTADITAQTSQITIDE